LASALIVLANDRRSGFGEPSAYRLTPTLALSNLDFATYFAAEAYFRVDRVVTAARGIVVSDYFDRLALDRALDTIGDAERRLTAAMVETGATGEAAVEAWVKPRQAEVERIRAAIHQIAGSGLTLSKLTVTASLLGDLARG